MVTIYWKKLFEIKKCNNLPLGRIWKGGRFCPPPRTKWHPKVLNNFVLFARKMEQKLTQTPNNSFLSIDTLKLIFEIINCMSMWCFITENIFCPISVRGRRFCSIGYYFFEYLMFSVLIFYLKVHINIYKSRKKLCF